MPDSAQKVAIQFLFPGHGSERVDMTRQLYEQVDIYRDEVDHCLQIIDGVLGFDLKNVLFPDPAQKKEATKRLSQTVAAQPALFIVEYSLAKILGQLGIEPDGMLGHSVSEYVAACLAGVFSLESALEIVVKRGQLIQGLQQGSMLAVALPEEEVLPYLNDRISLGSTIGQRQCVVSGFTDSVQQLHDDLRAKGVECRPVRVTRAFHSMMLDPVLEEFGEFVGCKKLHPPQNPFISGIDGKWVDPEEVQKTDYWVRQLRSPVRFFEGISELAKTPESVFVEVGKGSMLMSLVRSHPMIDKSFECLSTCPASYQKVDDLDFLLDSLDKLEAIGLTVERKPLFNGNEGKIKRSSTKNDGIEEDEDSTSISENILTLEKQVSGYFCHILGVEKINRAQNFLESGGNSLMAMQVISRIRKHLDVAVPIKDFFRDPTIQGVAKLIMDPSGAVALPGPSSSSDKKKSSSSLDAVDLSDQSRAEDEAVFLGKNGALPKSRASMEFSLFFFSGDEGEFPGDRYKLVMEGAKFADENGFDAIWIPERHFNKFGGLYPNPSVLGAAIAASTKQVHVRGGSVVAPLHHPVRIAEEWSVVDNLSKGRVGIAFGSGFHPNDFLLAPQAFPNRKEVMFESIHAIQNLWKGGSYRGPAGSGDEIEVKLLPRPYSKELPTWLATTRSPDTFAEAGELGGNVLTALLRLSVPELRERIAVYREALEKAGYDPHNGVVTVMLHTFVGPDMDYVRSRVEAPLKEYLQSHMEHTKAVSREKTDGEEIDLSPEEEEALLDHAFERYFETSSLMGTEESCMEMIQKLKEAGVDEVACLIDFGVDYESLMTSLTHLNRLRLRANGLEVPKLSESKPVNVANGWGKEESGPLSLGQQRLWFFDQFEPNTPAYNLKLALRLKGDLQVELLEQAVQQIIARHEVLRTRIQTEEGKPIQIVESSLEFELPFRQSGKTGDELHQLIQQEVHRPFDLSQGPLFRISLFEQSKDEYILLLVTHHIISDGWSLALLKKEIISLYKALSEGSPSSLPPLKTTFFDFCRWQLEQGKHFETQLDYWRERLAGISPLVELPTDFPRPKRQTSNGAEVRLDFPNDLAAELRKIGSGNKASLFMVLLGAFQTLLHRYSGKDDIVVGVPTAGRVLPEFEDLLGLFINNLPMRADFSGDPTFLEFLGELNGYALDAYAHQEVPFERLVEEFEPERDLSRTPLFQVMFAFQNYPNDEVPLSEITMEPYEVEGTSSAFDLAFYIYEVTDGLSLKLQYNRDLFRESTMERMLRNFQVLLNGISRNPEQRISELPLLSDWERKQVLIEWNKTEKVFNEKAFTHELIEIIADRVGDRLAAIFPATGTLEESRLTYRELNKRSNKLAHYLIGLGVGPEVIVGICLDRREEMLISVLGTLKAGGAYLPLDATLPKERQLFMLEDSGAKILITENELTPRFEGETYEIVDLKTVKALVIEQESSNPEVRIADETLAYVIYTSGSTGRPKGVEICHGALGNFLKSMLEVPGLQETDRLLAITTLSFDIAALEIFLPLIAGASIVVADAQATVDGQRIRQLLSDYQISVMQGTPSTWRILLESGWKGDGTLTLLCGGEALEASLAEKLSKQCRQLWNLYGPTETTIWSSCYDMSRGGPVLIGRPIANTTFFVLDHALNPVPIGVPGDLFIGGKGLARGYRNRPDLTSKHFLEIPFDGGKTFYRTGDRARWLETGDLECFGRSDHQIKLRGYRIELGEIEAGLTGHPDVIEAAVVVRGKKIEDQRLVAYVSVRTDGISSEVLQDHVGETLPEYMVPSLFVWLDKLPKTANGKIDRKALPEVNGETESLRDGFIEPGSSTERAVAAIWAEVLGLKQVGLQDSFFRIGGHSLTSIQLISKINRQFSLNLPVYALFENPTLEKFSRVIESSKTSDGTMLEEKRLGINKIGLGSDIRLHKITSTKTKENEKFFRGIKNRILQLIARVTPNTFRIHLHRWRGVSVGQNVGIGYDSIIETSCPWLVSIGDRSRIGMRVTIIGHFAEMEGSSDNASNPTVQIEADVWIGPSVTILPNVTIGRGSVVAAGSTVTMAVPPETFVQGNPAKPVARCRVPLTRDVTYDEFIQNLELMEEKDDSAT